MNLNGGNNGDEIDGTVVAYLAKTFFTYSMPFEGAESLFSKVVMQIRDDVSSRSTSSRVALPEAIVVQLQRLYPDHEDLTDLEPILDSLEETILSSEREKKDTAAALVGVKMLAKNTTFPQFLRAFGLPTVDPQQFLMESGFELEQAEQVLQGPVVRAIGVDLILLTLWAVVVHFVQRNVEGYQATLTEKGLEDREVPQQDIPTSARRSTRISTASQLEPREAATTRTTRVALTADQKTIAAMAKEIAALKAMVAAQSTREARGEHQSGSNAEDDEYMSDDDEVEVPDLGQQNGAGEDNVFDDQPDIPLSSVPPVPDQQQSLVLSRQALKGPLLGAVMLRTRANFRQGSDLTFDELSFMLNSELGFFMLGVDGVPVVMKPVTVNKYTTMPPPVSTALYNPDADTYLSGLGVRQVSAHLYCASIGQFNALMSDQLMKLMSPSALFPSKDRNELMQTLHRYHQKIQDRLADLCGGDPSPQAMQQNPRHVTLWALIFVFHLNRWMRAMIYQDLTLLLKDFDSQWYTTYSNKVIYYPGQRAEISLEGALSFLLYRCPVCYRLGACVYFCSTPTCITRLASTKPAAASHVATPSGYMAAYKAWRKAENKPDTPASKSAFAQTADYKAHPEWDKKPKTVPAAATGVASPSDYFDRQDMIVQHLVPRMQI